MVKELGWDKENIELAVRTKEKKLEISRSAG
jgi:hypothetical protein